VSVAIEPKTLATEENHLKVGLMLIFTTKPQEKCTGLGLSISYQIVAEKHGGVMECISEPGKGAEFVLAIPLN
jgi:nitrogen-specific signal transduction histidine kinase